MTNTAKENDKYVHFIPINDNNLTKYSKHIRPLENDILLVCDIDSTLYHKSTGLEKEIYKRLTKFLCTITSTQEEAAALNKKFYTAYGLTTYGVLAERPDVDRNFYTTHISSTIKYEEYLRPDNALRDILNGLKCRKICFTNGDNTQARAVLNALGLTTCFEAVITVDISRPYFVHKPMKESYEFVNQLFQVRQPENVIFFDDNIRNIQQATECGWHAYHVQNDTCIGDIMVKLVKLSYVNIKKMALNKD